MQLSQQEIEKIEENHDNLQQQLVFSNNQIEKLKKNIEILKKVYNIALV
jgi:hypothetical protein